MKNHDYPMYMGGFGSGRTTYASTPTDRACLKLDINEFTDALDTDEQQAGVYTWTQKGEQTNELYWRTIDEAGSEGICLKYAVISPGGDPDEQEYRIWITRTDCNFGGTRPWFRCPGLACNERAGKLYLPPGARIFLCRDCHDFGYTSSRASGNPDRTLRLRYNRIRKKLGAEPCHPNSFDARPPERPKGMHEETYQELLLELRMARDRWEDKAFWGPLRRMTDAPTTGVD